MSEDNRTFNVKKMNSVEELVHEMLRHKQDEPTGYQLGNYLFLRYFDIPQGYAVFLISGSQHVNLESVTVKWPLTLSALEKELSQKMCKEVI
jgi:hypothetical protein